MNIEQMDNQIATLTKRPELIPSHWGGGLGMFEFVGERAHPQSGCLTLIRSNPLRYKAIINGVVDEELTKEIAADERLPADITSANPEHFPIFKEWWIKINELSKN